MTSTQRAIVIGGGISGKLAARVLSDVFHEVIIIEKDEKPDGPIPRKGTPQGKHLHALLFAGQYGLEALFPRITEQFHSSGALRINSTKDLAWFHHGVWKLRYDSNYTTTLQTRPHLEWHIEQYIERVPNITSLYGKSVMNFLHNIEENRIYGVELRNSDHSVEALTADLIVDASGTSSFTTGWLNKMGIEIPKKVANIGLNYFSRSYQLPDHKDRDWKIKILYPNPPHEKIGGTISRIEGNRYIVTLMAYQNEVSSKEISNNDQGFLELAKRLPKLDIYNELKRGTPVTEISSYRVPQMNWKRYDQVKRLPDGLLMIGDTVCRIDPVFGQGMSIAVLEALTLQKLLTGRKGSVQQSIQSYHKKIAKTLSPIWKMVLIENLRYPGTTGKKPLGLAIQQHYARSIFLLSSQDQKVFDSFVNVMNLVRPTSALLRPRTIKSVLRHMLFKR